jgi:sugar O-acyltransferase (sialic acid O-acetyltransferase NeuD family)
LSLKQIAVYGAGGFGRELAWLVQSCNDVEDRYELVCFIDDNQDLHGGMLNELRIFGLQQAHRAFPKAKVVCGVGIPRTRETIVNKAREMGFNFEAVIQPRIERSQWIDIGEGAIICAGNILTTNITIGRHVHINLGCTIGHDVRIGDYSTLAPGVHVSGYVYIGSRVYVGTGAVFVNGTESEPLVIGDDVTIGAGACVTRSIEAGQTVVGVPARPIGQAGNQG